MAINNSQRAGFATELTATMTGSTLLVGTITQSPVIIIFDNQGADAVALYVNGTAAANLWRTFPGGEALTLDLRSNHGLAANFTFDIGTTFYANGTNTDGPFSISYIFAVNT
jgi:hypothetical protein